MLASPRSIRRWAALAALLLSAPAFTIAADPAKEAPKAEKGEKVWLFVGTYSAGGSKGIYRFEFDPATGKIGDRELAAEAVNPSFLTIAPSHKFLYAVNEVGEVNGKKGGGVSAFSLDPLSGKLTFLNQQTSGGGAPCYVSTDKAGKNVFVANYSGGSVESLPVGEDGKLGEPTSFIQHKGTPATPKHENGPRAHSINLDAANKFAVAADLGLDQLLVYKFDAAKGTLTPNDPPFVANPGGPRHFAFHPNGKFGYIINELGMTVTALAYDADKGVLKPLQTITTLPKGAEGKDFSTAEVQVHPSGKFLYGSNRGHNSIAIFSIDQETGKLTPVGHATKDIKIPRNFGIDPTGQFVIVANQEGNSLVVFKIDQKTGDLTPTGEKAEVPIPVCVKMFVKPAK
jgi:6-phosphogluconolactonase